MNNYILITIKILTITVIFYARAIADEPKEIMELKKALYPLAIKDSKTPMNFMEIEKCAYECSKDGIISAVELTVMIPLAVSMFEEGPTISGTGDLNAKLSIGELLSKAALRKKNISKEDDENLAAALLLLHKSLLAEKSRLLALGATPEGGGLFSVSIDGPIDPEEPYIKTAFKNRLSNRLIILNRIVERVTGMTSQVLRRVFKRDPESKIRLTTTHQLTDAQWLELINWKNPASSPP